MTSRSSEAGVAEAIGLYLPFLRRYARALTGNQTDGDNYAAATLEAIISDPSILTAGDNPRIGLFRAFHAIWQSSGALVAEGESGLAERAQARMRDLTPGTREALLLHTLEEFSVDEIAAVLGVEAEEVRIRLEIANREMEKGLAGRVLIIEDETIIAMDLQGIVTAMGHEVIGIARTATQAVETGTAQRPDLVLADIRLADDSSGIDAVNVLLGTFGNLPVIFVTAYPERLLTGERPEPAFLIAKPYSEEQVRSAVSQAMFFSSVETLEA